VNQLVLTWDEPHAEGELAAPTLADVVNRLSALDGVVHTLMTLYQGEGHIACGGSAVSGMVFYVTFDNETFWQLADPRASQSEVLVLPVDKLATVTYHEDGLQRILTEKTSGGKLVSSHALKYKRGW
jgi:hypothetical protein